MHTHKQQVKLQITIQGFKQLIKTVQTSRKKSLTNTIVWEKLVVGNIHDNKFHGKQVDSSLSKNQALIS